MVKQFISGILGKKEESQQAAKEEVPDELPPLAEEVVAKTLEPKKEAKPEAKEPEKEVPEELPPLEELPKPDENLEHGTIEDLDKENIPDAIKKAKLAKAKPETRPAAEPTAEDMKKARDEYTPSERIKAGAEAGFFSNILEHVKEHGAKEKLLSGDLFLRMGGYWELRKNEIKTGMPLPVEKKLEMDLVGKLQELSAMEKKWQVQKLALEEDMKFVHEREREIQAKIEELKLVSNELGLFKNVKPEEYFYLHNGIVIKNLHDLIDILEVIDEDTLAHHFSERKNDFSEWILHVFKDNNLAGKVRNAKTRLELIEILENIPVSEEGPRSMMHVTNPRKYFWLANGTVIRNLYELSDALKTMADELFAKHVNESKNDFARWIDDVIKNKSLAGKIAKAKNRKDMIDILEVFL